jgi:integrase
MKSAVVRTQVRGKIKWKVNLRKKLTGSSHYHRRYFGTKAAATKFYNRVVKEVAMHGAAFAELSDSVRAGLAKFYALLQTKNLTLEAAAQFAENYQPGEAKAPEIATLSVREALEQFFGDCTDGALEKGTMREYCSHLNRFAKTFGNRPLKDVNKKNIKTWLTDIGVKDRTKKNYITTLRTFFEFCVREEAIIKNPAKLVRKPKENAKTPAILSIEDVVKFAGHICEHEPRLIAPMAIALFAGVRMSELFELLWSDINFKTREIHVRKEIAKKPKQKERWIKMSDNLVAWLSVCPEQEGKVCSYPTLDNLWEHRRKAFKKATGKNWPPNGSRHSFASYSWTVGRDLKHTANQLGNSPQVAQKNYIAGVEGEKGLLFIQIVPEPKEPNTPTGDGAKANPTGVEEEKH